VYGSTATQTGNVTAIQFQTGDIGMNAVGNVLGATGISTVYEAYDSGPQSIFELGSATDVSATSLLRDGNYDVVHASTVWTTAAHGLPPSLYLKRIPAWWPGGVGWPWVGPDASPMTGTLPAKMRSDMLP
jgi:hypothetical protein